MHYLSKTLASTFKRNEKLLYKRNFLFQLISDKAKKQQSSDKAEIVEDVSVSHSNKNYILVDFNFFI